MKQKTTCLRLVFIIFFVLFLSKIASAEAPVPWGAKLIVNDVAVSGQGEERKIVSYETKASKQEILNYYLKEMPKRGYNLFMNGEQNLIFNKGDELVIIVVPPSQNGKTTFMLSSASTKEIQSMSNSLGAEANCVPIPGFSIYPGARCVSSTHLKSGGTMSASYSTEDSDSTVLDFYKAQMPRFGWQLEKELDLKDALSKAMPLEQRENINSQQQAAINNLYGSVRAIFFTNLKGNSCSIHVMNNPTVRGEVLINVIYEEKAKKQ